MIIRHQRLVRARLARDRNHDDSYIYVWMQRLAIMYRDNIGIIMRL